MNRRIVGSVCFALLSSLTTTQLYGQDELDQPPSAAAANNPEEEKSREVISVVGSRIRRTDVEGLNPVQILNKDDLEASGFNTIGDVLRELPVTTFGALREQSGRRGASGSSANLRGLGSEYTLVLIDGNRLPSDPVLETVDISEIPIAMVERIEILKEGASAIYGSDAVGGVINVVTRKRFTGVSALYSRTFTAEKGGDEQRIEIIGGTATGTTSLTLAATYRDRSIIMARDREYAAEGWSTLGNPASFMVITDQREPGAEKEDWRTKPGTGAMPDPNCQNTDLNRLNVGGSNSYCEFNYAKTMSVVPSSSQFGMMANFEHEFNSNFSTFAFIKDTRRTSRWNYAAAPERVDVTDKEAVQKIRNVLGSAGDQIDLGEGDGVRIFYRTTELGTRDTLIQEKNTAGILGFRGAINPDWEWEVSATKGRNWRYDVGERGYWLISSMRELISSGAYNPLDPNRDTSVLEVARHQPWHVEESYLDQYNLTFTGSFGELSGGPISVAFGSSYVEERYKIRADQQSILGYVAGSSGSTGEGNRNFKSVFAEAALPFSERFELSLAGRFDQYSDAGKTTNPRLSFRYNLPQLLLRGSVGTGFRAPTLQTITSAGGYGYPSFIDAVACANAREAGSAPDIEFYCTEQQYLVNTSAAENLKPEKTLTANFGLIYEPNVSFNLGLDFWFIQIKDRIGIPDYNLLTEAELAGNRNYEKAGIAIARQGTRNEIREIGARNANLSRTEVSGVDLNANYNVGSRSSFRFDYTLDTVYYFYYKDAVFEGMPLTDRIGRAGRPQWRANNGFNFSFLSNHSLGLLARTTASTYKADKVRGRIPVHNEFDLQYSFLNFWNGTLSVGGTNILNTKPPADESQNPTVDIGLYNNLGAAFYVKLTQNF